MSKAAKLSASSSTAHYRPETRLVHGGTLRSQYGETSEAMFLTQGYVYESAESCEARFKGEDPGYIYSRYSNPTIAMFEQRILRMRFGIGGMTDHTLEEVGKVFGLTRERIRQIEAKALEKLRHPRHAGKLAAFAKG